MKISMHNGQNSIKYFRNQYRKEKEAKLKKTKEKIK